MLTKKNASFIVTIALSMIILAYISYVAVYEQILSKSNGFFNVILFGVVLILVFIFITLLARIITLNPDNKDTSPVLRILIIIGIVAIFGVFVFSRLNYTSSVMPMESVTYKAANAMCNDNLSKVGEVHDKLISYPGDFSYALLMSFVFRFTESAAYMFTIVNIVMMLITAAFLFATVQLISGRACAAFAVIFFMFMPNNTFLVYSYNSELFVAANFMISLFLYLLLIYKRFKTKGISVVISVLCGIFSGISVCSEPVLLIAYIALLIWIFKAKRQTTIAAVLPIIISFVFAGIILLVKSIMMDKSFLDVLLGVVFCFVPTVMRDSNTAFSIADMFDGIKERFNDPSRFLNDNIFFLKNSNDKVISKNQAVWLEIADQIIYIFMLILCVMCVVYILRVVYDKIMPMFSVLIALFVGQILGGANKVGYIYFVAAVVVIGSTTIYYMYLNHHNDYAVLVTNEEIAKDEEIRKLLAGEEVLLSGDMDNQSESEDTVLDDEYLRRAKALIFLGEDEEYYRQIKQQEKIERLNNPFAATRIKTTLSDEGEYDSIEENLEFFDELDEMPKEAKVIHEVKPIPSTRPVETVKPVLADDYYLDDNMTVVASSFDNLPIPEARAMQSMPPAQGMPPAQDIPMMQELPPVQEMLPSQNIQSMQNNFAQNDTMMQNSPDNGFVFRKKEKNTGVPSDIPRAVAAPADARMQKAQKKEAERIAKEQAKEAARIEKENLKLAKKNAKLAKKGIITEAETVNSYDAAPAVNPYDVAPGEPLPNPMPVPKPHVGKDMDFDFDINGADDFDV